MMLATAEMSTGGEGFGYLNAFHGSWANLDALIVTALWVRSMYHIIGGGARERGADQVAGSQHSDGHAFSEAPDARLFSCSILGN